MPIVKIPKLTDGLNELANPENLPDGGLQESVNFEILGDHKLTRRREPEEYGDDVSGDSLKTKLAAVFTQSILQVSPPLYPVKKIVDATGTRIMDGDFVILVYGSTAAGVYELYMCYENTSNTWDVVKVEITGITYTVDTYLEFFVGDDKMIITDTYDLTTNFPHYIKIDGDGDVISGLFSIKSPTNKPTMEAVTEYEADEFEEDVDDVNLGDCGIVQCAYTVVTKDGDESNPSPISDSRMMQFFKKDLTDKNDIRWIDSFRISNLSVPVLTGDLTEELKYFNVYFRIIRYSEGEAAEPFYFSQRFEIVDKTNNEGDTGNGYLVTVPQDESLSLSYENDIAPYAKHAAETSSIVGFGNVREKVRFPFDFDKYCPILINNVNNKNYADGIVCIRIYDENNTGTLDYDGNQVDMIDDLDLSYYNKVGQSTMQYLDYIRIYDADLVTPLKAYYREYFGAAYIDVYVKVPLLTAGQIKYLYLVWNIDGGTADGVTTEEYQTAEYGEFTMITATNIGDVFDTERVKSSKTVICSPMDYLKDGDVLNLADDNNPGEIINDDSSFQDGDGTKQLFTQSPMGLGSILLKSDDDYDGVSDGKFTAVKYSELPYEELPDNTLITFRLRYENMGNGLGKIICLFNKDSSYNGVYFSAVQLSGDSRWSLSYAQDIRDGGGGGSAVFNEIPVSESGDVFIALSIKRGENISIFVGDLASGNYYTQELGWDGYWLLAPPPEDYFEDMEAISLGYSAYADGFAPHQDFKLYISQFQLTINKYYSADDEDDITAIYNIANFMPGFETALGKKIITED